MARVTLSLPRTLHDELSRRAEGEGVSMNEYIVYVLTRHAAASNTVQVLSQESIIQQQERYEKLLDSLGPSSLQATKAFLAERQETHRPDAPDA